MRPSSVLPAAIALVAAAALPSARLAAQQVDVIRGRITDPENQPLADVQVTATSVAGNVSRTARTGKDGRFTITFPGGDGDYMVSVAALGFQPRRFEVRRTADQEILVADARLQRVGAVLDAVNVVAPRGRVARTDNPPPDISGSERGISSAAIPVDQMGDLAAMAASLPGVQLVPGQDGGANGFSVLGLGADQNQTTLNGMAFGGGNLPRDAMVGSSLATSPYDVSRGGFSGGQFALRTRPGSNFVTRGSSLNLDAPALQWTDPAARALGQQYTNLSLGGAASGPVVWDKAFYNVSYQLGRRSNDWQTLLNTSASGLQAAGVSADSAARLSGILGTAGVPLTVADAGSSRLSDNGVVFGSIDVAPPGSTRGQSLNLTFNGSWNRQMPAAGGVTDLPGASGERTSWRGGLQGRHSAYLKGILTETSFGFGGSTTASDPFLRLPAGRVRVNSTFADGSMGVSQLGFGGNPFLDFAQSTSNAGFMNQLSWFSLDNRHRLKLTSELRRDGYEQDQATNLLGTFTYNSLAELEAGQPAVFSRNLGRRRLGAAAWTGGLSLGDAWRRTDDLQIQYGVRVDGTRFEDRPAYNPAVESAFGVRNDEAPDRVYVSPRAGFSWTYGTAAQIGGFEGAMRGPRAVVRGGVGLFQGTPQVQQLGGALAGTGLASGIQQVTCVGAAAPVPDWDGWLANPATIPTACADGTSGTSFGNAAPNVTLFSRDWQAPRSWRGNLQWSGPVLGNRFSATVDATYSLNQHQQATRDLNFAGTQGFALAGEGGRPVYVDPSRVVPATGQVDPRAGRVSDAFTRVAMLESGLESHSRQLRVSLAPSQFSSGFSWNGSYVYGNVREEFNGFQSTAGDPRATDWSRSSFDSRHQVQYSLGYNFFDAVRVSWFGQFRSGSPFTPTVQGDVNGDGWGFNDRAHVFDPAAVADDPALAEGMRALLDGGSREAKRCLRAQLGRIAGRNSCEGPWTSSATLNLTLNPVKFHMPYRATLSLQVANPLGAADLLLNGSRNLRGWGQQAMPDASLLYVRGFDQASQRFVYEVNQRFGATRPQASAIRAPVTVTALLRFDVGPTRERQMLTQQLDRGRIREGQKLPEPIIKQMLGLNAVPNPLATILRQQDTLQLTGAQADSIASLNRWYTIRVDSIWSPVARKLGSLPDRYDHGVAYDDYMHARRATIDLLAGLSPTVKGLLTPAQRRRLPPAVATYLDPRYLASIRSGTATFTGGGMPIMGGGAPMIIQGGGGGGVRTIIRQ